MKYFAVLVSTFVLTSALSISAAETAKLKLPSGISKVTSVEGITEYRLNNGLKVLLFPDASKPTITVNITYLVGSRHENYGETGMAHLLEHMLFKGSSKFPKVDIDFNKRGMRSNASTSLDRTNYFELFQANDDNLQWALEMEADRMLHSFVARKDLDTEMTVVRNEFERGENGPIQVLIKRLQSVAYDWHNYGNSTIGNRSDIENVGIENLQAFYHRYYQPDNAVLLIAGKFDEARALTMVAKNFASIAKPKRVLPALWTVEPTQDGERRVMVRRKGDIQWLTAAYKVPSGRHPDADALAFADYILTDSPSGRLHKALVETGKATQVFGEGLFGVDVGLHIIGASVKKGDAIEPVEAEMTTIVEAFFKNGPTKEEMDRARKSFANDAEKELNNHERIGLALSEYIALGDWRLFFYGRDHAEKISAEEVVKAAEKYYKRDNRTVGIFVPEDAPQRAEIPVAASATEVLKNYVGKAALAEAEAFDPAQANIDKRTAHRQIGGVKVAMLGKKNRGETVNLNFSMHLGDEKSLFGKRIIAQLTGAMLSRGTSKFSRVELADQYDKFKISGGVAGPGASLQTTREFLPDAIKLIAHILKEPAFPESEFVQLKKQQLTAIEAQRSDPNAKAGERLGQVFNIYPAGDWRASSTLDESIAEINRVTLDDIKAFHRDFYGASNAELAIVGDFDEAAAIKVIDEQFANWKAKLPYTRLSNLYKDIAPVNEAVETPDKENATFLARQNVSMKDDDIDYAALYLANYIIGGGADLNSRLADRIRQKEGLSYTVASTLNVGTLDRAGSWSVFAIAAPQNIGKVEAAFKEEINKVLVGGFTAAEVSAAKSGAIQKRSQSRAQDATLAGTWQSYLHYDRTFAFNKAFEEKIAALKPEELQNAVKKYIDPAKISIVKAGDFKKVAK